MLYVGFDTGTELCGTAELRDTQSGIEYVHAGVLDMKRMHGGDPKRRLVGLYWNVRRMLGEIYNDYAKRDVVIGIELPYVWKSIQTAILLGRAVGMIHAACAEPMANYVYFVQATEAKKALVGDGGASKKDVQTAVELQFGVKLPEDAADAVSVALAARVKYTENMYIGK